MIGITPRKGDKVWVMRDHRVDDIKLVRETGMQAVFMGYERGHPIVRWPDGRKELLLSDNYMRVA